MAATDPAEHERPAKERRTILGEFKWVIICSLGLFLLGGVSIGYRYGVTLPRRVLEAALSRPDPFEDPEHIRALCHRVLRVPIGDCSVACWTLASVGDETSVPILINALWWGQRATNHALMVLTNHKIDLSYSDWCAWYERHRHESRLAWMADGFTARGFPCTQTGDEASVRWLLRAAVHDHYYAGLAISAEWLLGHYDQAMVRRVLDEVASSGDRIEKEGLLEYLSRTNKADAEQWCRRLKGDTAPGVKYLAGSTLLRLQIRRLEESPTPPERRIALKDHHTTWLQEAAEGFLYYQSDRFLVAYDLSRAEVLWKQEIGEEGEVLSIGNDCLVMRAEVGFICLDRTTGAQRWTIDLELHRPCASTTADDCVVISGFEGQFTKKNKGAPVTYVVDRTNGALLRKLDGTAVHTAGDTAYLLRDGALVKAALPGGETVLLVPSIPSEPRSIALVKDVAAVAVTRGSFPAAKAPQELWVEGWSLRTGQRLYATIVGDSGQDSFGSWDPRAVTLSVSPRERIHIMAEGFQAALDPSTGAILWVTSVDLREQWEVSAGDDLAFLRQLPNRALFFLLNGETGDVVAFNEIPRLHDFRLFRAGDKLYLLSGDSIYVWPIPTPERDRKP